MLAFCCRGRKKFIESVGLPFATEAECDLFGLFRPVLNCWRAGHIVSNVAVV
jgi:hypothetical protein